MTPIISASTSSAELHTHPQIDTFIKLTPETYLSLNSAERSSLKELYEKISDLSAWTFPLLLRPFTLCQRIMELQDTGDSSQSKTLANQSKVLDLSRRLLSADHSSSSTCFPSPLPCCVTNLKIVEDSVCGKRKFDIVSQDILPIAKKTRISPCHSLGDQELISDSQKMDIDDVAPPFELDLEGLESYDPAMKEEALRRITIFLETLNSQMPATLDLRGLRLYSLPACFYTEPMFANTNIDENPLAPRELPIKTVKNTEFFLRIFNIHTNPTTHRSREAVLNRLELPLVLIADYIGTSQMSRVCKTWEDTFLLKEHQTDYHKRTGVSKINHTQDGLKIGTKSIIQKTKKLLSEDLNLCEASEAIFASLRSEVINFLITTDSMEELNKILRADTFTKEASTPQEKASIIRTLLNSSERLCLSVRHLRLQSKNLTELPPELSLFKNLEELSLPGNKLRELPSWMSSLQHLKDLDLGSNEFKRVPECIFSLKNLKKLKLSRNQIEVLPREIGYLSSLECLDLTHNKLSSLPEEISSLASLTHLRLSQNKLSEFPLLPHGALPLLKDLQLSDNQFSVFPAGVTSLANLTELYLSQNQLSHFPTGIEKLEKLTRLYLDGNAITLDPDNLPPLATSYPDLAIDLRGNPIPDCIQQIVRETYPDYHYLYPDLGCAMFKDEDLPRPPVLRRVNCFVASE